MSSILITGSNRGIGLELTRQYLQDGWRVYATARKPEDAKELQQLKQQYPKNLSLHQLDIADEKQRQALKTELQDAALDILINNAGIYGQRDAYFGNTDETSWLETLKINTIAPMKIIESFADNIAHGEKKIIASMSSKMGSMDDNGSGGSYVYRSSKAALNAVMVSVARDLNKQGITSIILHPGWVRTDMGGPHGEIDSAESAQRLKQILAGVTLADSGSFYDIDDTIIPW